ncbi:MAG: sensor histidine kinase [Dokdonella sp.]
MRAIDQTVHRERGHVLLADTRRLSHTTYQLLAMAQADTVSVAESFGRNDLRQTVADSVERAFDRALKRDIDLGIVAPRTFIEGSAWLLNEALANLIDNALTHTPDGGRITVRCGTEGSSAFLEVEDDGCGIEPGERDRVRDRFHRGRNARGEGSGLGLAIVERAALVHDGSVCIDAGADGRGTRVRISLRTTCRNLVDVMT